MYLSGADSDWPRRLRLSGDAAQELFLCKLIDPDGFEACRGSALEQPLLLIRDQAGLSRQARVLEPAPG